MKTIKALGITSLLALSAAFAAPVDEKPSVGQLVQVVQAIPQALSYSGVSANQAKALQNVLFSVSGTYLTEQQASDALSQIQGILSSSQYDSVVQAATYQPELILPSSNSNPLAAYNSSSTSVQNPSSEAMSFLSGVVVPNSADNRLE